MKYVFAILFAALLLAGCASKGTKFQMADVDAMQPGVTTYQEAVKKLGKPYGVNFAEDGAKSVTWVWAMAGMVGSQSRATRILFDKDGKMIRVASKVEQ
ncbi:MAG: hypothetical protein WAW02_07145 [Sideroxyarcus sp.]